MEGIDRRPKTEGSINLIVKVDGQEVDCLSHLVSLTTYTAYGRIATADMVFADGGHSDGSFRIGDSEAFLVGRAVELFVGYGADASPIFSGEIVKHSIRLNAKKAELVLTAKHRAFRMSLVRSSRRFSDKSDAEVISEILRNAGIDYEVEDALTVHETLVQYNITDWDFVNLRAEANGAFVSTLPDGLVVRRPEIEAEPKLTIDSSFSVINLEAEMDGRNSFASYAARAWNYTLQEWDEVEVGTGSFDTEQGDLGSSDLASKMGNGQHPITLESTQENTDAMKSLVNAAMERGCLSRIVGKVTIPGYADIYPGDMIEFDRVGGRFNGGNVVSSVIHDVEGGDWQTILGFGVGNERFSDRFDDIYAKPADGVGPAVNGLQVAKVEQLGDDPLGENRIMVRLLTGDDTTLWARLSLMDAGKERGAFFMPEIGDEVVVGFINDNPNKAVVLGMLHSSQSPAPVEADDQNHIKGIYTREKLKLVFDDENKVVTIETPGGNSLSVSDKEKGIALQDQNGNKVTLSDGGIVIESVKSLTLKSSQDVTLEGNNINIKANMNLKATGNAGAELSTNGNAVVKGAVVLIN